MSDSITPESAESAELCASDRAILDLEESWQAGSLSVDKETAIRDSLGLSSPRYHKTTDMTCAVDLDKDFYKKIGDFDDRIPEPPSLRRATSLKVKGDWTFGSEVVVAGDVSLDTEKPQTIPDGTVLTGEVLGAKK